MKLADLLRQALVFVLGMLLLVYDALEGPPHDWVVLTLGLVMIGVVPLEWVLRLHDGHDPPGSGSGSSSTSSGS